MILKNDETSESFKHKSFTTPHTMRTTTSNTSTQSYIEERYENIAKSENDDRLYRGIQLTNKLKVLLISDPTTDKSAACLDVNIGHLNDPAELPGLAHFCEHMLFLGTKKYPEHNQYISYINQNGGSYNAFTHSDHTTYFFDINVESLSGALDHFAQFFLAPLFTESYTEHELIIIDSEHEKNVVNDIWRLDQINKSSANPAHPFSQFLSGNKQTLDIIPKQKGIDVREKLLEFYDTYYSANVMALSVLGKESLDELEEMVVKLFSEIKNKGVELNTWDTPFLKEHMQHYWYIVPVKDLRNLIIRFSIPDMRAYYEAECVSYISHLLGHEGEGSLLSALKAKGLCTTLLSGKWSGARGFDFFNISVSLTEYGIQHTDDIILMVFQYIHMLKKEGPVKWIWEEFRDIAKMEFRFKEKYSPSKYVVNTVYRLHEYPMEKVLTANCIFTEWRPDLINMLLDCLTPENIRVHIVGQMFKDIADETEPWYDSKFKKRRIPQEIIDKWTNAGLNPDLKLPTKNEFIPTKFDIFPAESTITKYPVIIEDTPMMRVWFKQDDEFLVPKGNISIDIVSPMAYMDPLSCAANYLLVHLIEEPLNECTYNAKLAGLKWEISSTKSGIMIEIGGYNDKQRVLLEKILDGMVNFEPNNKWFEIFKDNYIRSLKNFKSNAPYKHAMYYLNVLSSEKTWLNEELLIAASHLTLEYIELYARQFMSKWHVECLIHGNYTTAEAMSLSKLIETKLTSNVTNIVPLVPRQLHVLRDLQFDDGSHFLLEIQHTIQNSSCAQVYYQCGLQTTETNVLLSLLDQVLSEPCFSALRTKEQLGYILYFDVRKLNSQQGLRVLLQSDKDPRFVEHRIDAFLQSMVDYIKNMSEEDFNKHKQALMVKRLEKPKMLTTLTMKFWIEIAFQMYNFNRDNIEMAHLQTVTKEQLLQFFMTMIHTDTRRKLSMHILAAPKDKKEENEDKPEDANGIDYSNLISGYTKIEDITSFKLSQALSPLLPAWNGIPMKGRYSVSKL